MTTRKRFGYVEIGFCLCFHLSLSFRLCPGCPLHHVASPLWPGSKEESAGPVSLSASSFHLAPTKQFYLFIPEILRGDPLLLCFVSFFFSLYFPSLLAPLSLILSRLQFATSALAHLIPQTRSGFRVVV